FSHHVTHGLLSALLNQLGDQARPAGLMARAEARAVVAVKVFVERDVVVPVRVGLELLRAAEDRTPAARVVVEDADEPPREFLRHLPERHLLPGTGRE